MPYPTEKAQAYFDSTFIEVYGSKAVGLPVEQLLPKPEPTALRLIKTLKNGQLNTEFIYDSANRLIEGRTYTNVGEFILTAARYSYEDDVVAREDYLQNAALPTPAGPIQNSNLKPGGSRTYRYNITTGIVTTYGSDPSETGTTTDYGFDEKGRLLWSASRQSTVYVEPGLSVKRSRSSTLFKRDTQGNVVESVNESRFDVLYRTVTKYKYDQHKNPYALLTYLPGQTTLSYANPTRIEVNSSGYSSTTQYTYTYRPDGYPKQALVKTTIKQPNRDESTESYIIDYVYNQ